MSNSNEVKSYAKEAANRAQMKIYQVLLWIYRHGFATERVIQKLLGIERRPCASLVRRGVLTRVKPREGFRAAYVLGAAYLDRAQALHEAEVNMAMPYTQHRTAIPWIELAIHNELPKPSRITPGRGYCNVATTGEVIAAVRASPCAHPKPAKPLWLPAPYLPLAAFPFL